MQKLLILIIWLFILVLPCHNGYGQSGFVKSLEDEWLVYDDEYGSYVPYIETYHGNIQKKHLLLNTNEWKEFYLNVKGEAGTLIFVRNKLLFEIEEQQIDIPIRDIKGENVLISVFQPSGNIANIRVSVVEYANSLDNLILQTSSIVAPKERDISGASPILTILSIGLLGTLAILLRASTPILDIGYLKRYISNFSKSKNQGGRIDTMAFFFFLVLFVLSFSFIVLTINKLNTNISSEIFGFSTDGFSRLSLFTLISFVSFIFLAGKFLLIWVLSILYDFRKLVNIHIQEYMNVNQFYALSLVLIAVMLNFSKLSQPLLIYNSLQFTVITMLLISSFLVSYRIIKAVPFRKIYLIAYLCATEILPAFILVKFLIEN